MLPGNHSLCRWSCAEGSGSWLSVVLRRGGGVDRTLPGAVGCPDSTVYVHGHQRACLPAMHFHDLTLLSAITLACDAGICLLQQLFCVANLELVHFLAYIVLMLIGLET